MSENKIYKIIKVLNNNTILAVYHQEETIIMAKGIGFSKKANELIEIPRNAKKYLMQKDYEARGKAANIINYIDPVYLEIASEIIRLASEKFDQVDNDILLPLADHIFFAIKRMKENLMPSNPFLTDIRLLFPDEYEVAFQGKQIIKKYTGMTINDDEAGFITLHIHSAISSNRVVESMEATRVVHDSIVKLQKDLNIVIDINSISYVRLMNHIKFLILRLNTNEELQMNITDFAKEKFPFAYDQAVNMCDALSKALNKQLPEAEVGYLALHLERILSSIQ